MEMRKKVHLFFVHVLVKIHSSEMKGMVETDLLVILTFICL